MAQMQQLTESQVNAEVPVNENFEALEHQAVYAQRQPAHTGLTWGYYGGRWSGIAISDGTLTLTASQTNYVVVNRSTGAISTSTSATNWNNTASFARVYKITTGTAAVSAVEDHRVGLYGVHGGSAGTLSGLADVDAAGSPALDTGEVLVWDAATSRWRPRPLALRTLSDVDAAGSPALDDGDILAWDATTQRWRPRPDGGGGGSSTQGKHSIPVLAGAMLPSTSNGCAPLAQLEISSSQPEIVTLDFDPTIVEYAQFSIPMPKKWNEGTVTAKFLWSHPATTTNFGVRWGLQAVAVSDDDPIAVAYGTAQEVTDTGGTTNDLYHSAETGAITIAGTPQAEDMVFFRVYRDPTNGADTMAVDARLHAVVIYITTAAETDA